jgi:hypothetical protein
MKAQAIHLCHGLGHRLAMLVPRGRTVSTASRPESIGFDVSMPVT